MKAKKYFNLNTDRLLSLLAFVTSIATVLALMYQTSLSKKQNQLLQKEQYASVMPYLTIGFSKSENGSFGMILDNDGLGPAFINKVQINYNDSIYDMEPIIFYSDVLRANKKDSVEMTYSSLSVNSILPAGEEKFLFLFEAGQDKAIELLGPFADLSAKIQIEYASIYGDKWFLKSPMEQHLPLTKR